MRRHPGAWSRHPVHPQRRGYDDHVVPSAAERGSGAKEVARFAALILLLGLQAGAAPATTDATPGGLDLVVATDQRAYARGEPIRVTLEIVNRGTRPVELRFPTAQRYDLLLHDAQGRPMWRWSDGQMFAQVLGEETVEPGRRLVYRVTVRERLPAGRYRVTGIVPGEPGPLSSTTGIRVD